MMNSNMFAPDVIEIEGKYYMYYGVGLSRSGFGVAVSDSPVGPFEYIGRVRYPESEKKEGQTDDKDGINDGDLAFGYGYNALEVKPGKGFGLNINKYPYDPAVIYDKGRLFLYYGLAYCRVVELDINDKRTVIKNETTNDYGSDVLVPSMFPTFDKTLSKSSSDNMGMVNAPSIRLIDDVYHLSYYAKGPNKSDAMCYATSKDPLGPFEYKGTLVSLGNANYKSQTLPTDYVGNTHGGMVEINGVWYTVYHRQTGNRAPGRQACATALVKDENGKFQHAEYTSLGFSQDSVPAYYTWPAYMACYLTDSKGKTKKNSNSPFIELIDYPGGEIDVDTKKEVFQVVTNLTEGSVVGFKYFDFGNNIKKDQKVTITTKVINNSIIHVCTDEPCISRSVSSINVSPSKEWKEYSEQIKQVSGVHSVYLVVETENKLGEISLIEFTKQ